MRSSWAAATTSRRWVLRWPQPARSRPVRRIGRILTLSEDASGNAFNQGPITFFAEGRDANRFPTLKTMDFRVAKFFVLGRQRFEAIGDFFNLFNVSTVTSVNSNSGSDFDKPTDILGPRVFRIGGRWTF